jgi:Transposase IS116/IS110/IS902 family
MNLVDEGHYQGNRGSSSRAKNEDAASRISFARFSSRFSRSSSLSRAASLVVVPDARPASTSACLHQPRSVSGFIPTRGPIRFTAAFNDNPGSCSRASCTSRCARSRNSFGYFLGAGTTTTLPWHHTLHETADGSALLAEPGVGPVTAAQLLISWSHRGRVRNEAAFAALAGAAPLEASSGQRIRHRLNRGGDRDLNRALHTIAITRLRCHPESRAYEIKRTAQGKTHRDVRRSLKRALARRLYRRIQTATRPTDGPIAV